MDMVVESIDCARPAAQGTTFRQRQPVWMLAAAKVIPAAPPCFSTRDIWVSYVLDSASTCDGETPSILRDSNPPRMNPKWSFCADCLIPHRARMAQAGKCNPDYLKVATE